MEFSRVGFRLDIGFRSFGWMPGSTTAESQGRAGRLPLQGPRRVAFAPQWAELRTYTSAAFVLDSGAQRAGETVTYVRK